MIDAKEAKRIVEDTPRRIMQEWRDGTFEAIKRASRHKYRDVRIKYKDRLVTKDEAFEFCVKFEETLKELGYTVKFDLFSTLVIKW